ncbi:DUF2726 domain-containing protein [Vibrio navarrensis]|nr:DUF2726 domain-containing protein [Vibrio navarrensis]
MDGNNIYLFAIILIGIVVFLVFKRKMYKPVEFINSKAEQNFFNQICRVLPEHLWINCKVRLADICMPTSSRNIRAFNQIARKHVDFVLFEKKTGKILCVIELDDRSHLNLSARKRDRVKNYALSSSGVRFYRIKAARNYTSEISSLLREIQSQN